MALEVERATVSPKLSARWQWLLQRWRLGRPTPAFAGCAPGEVSVVALLRSPPVNGCALGGLRLGAHLGLSLDGRGWLVTGRLPLSKVERLLTHDAVAELEPAAPLMPLLGDSTLELFAQPEFLPACAAARQGAGAWIGILDGPCDWRHPHFRDADGRPRIACSWRQGAEAHAESPFGYGFVCDRRELWLAAEVETIETDCPHDCRAHGTQVLDMAVGNGSTSAVPGVAPRADVAYVALPTRRRRRRLGDTVSLLEGARYIFDQAGARPCAVNVSLGGNAGPHDGTSLVEQGLDALTCQAPNRFITVAAGNSGAEDAHAFAELVDGRSFDLSWNAPCDSRARHAVEIWYDAADEIDLELAAPRGPTLVRVAAGENCRLVEPRSGRVVAFVAHQERHGLKGDRAIAIFVERGAPAGTWTARLVARRIVDGRVHAWIDPHDDARPVFVTGMDDRCTLNGLACGLATFAVGAFDAHRPELPLAWYTSAGPTRDGRPKPDASAPGHRVWTANPALRQNAVERSGTSLAAAAATGVAALVMAEAAALERELSASQIAELLRCTARTNPPRNAWHERYGFGRLDAATALSQLMGPSLPNTS